MKRLFIVTLWLIWGSAIIARGQSFTYTAPETELPGTPGELTQFYSEIQNLESDSVTFWVEMQTNVPSGWNVNFCTWLCFPPWVTLDTNYVIPRNAADTVLVDVYPDSSGSEGWVTMKVYPEGHPELADSIEFYVYFLGGQNFTYTAPATELPGVPYETTQFYSEIQNLDTLATIFNIEMDTTNLPPGWTASFYAGDSIPPGITEATLTIFNGEMDSILVDITPDSSSIDGSVTMTVYPIDHPELAVAIDFHLYLPDAVTDRSDIPALYNLLKAYPNPFNAELHLSVTLQHPETLDLSIFDLEGRKITRVFYGELGAGRHNFSWHPETQASGIYLARLSYRGNNLISKIVYLR